MKIQFKQLKQKPIRANFKGSKYCKHFGLRITNNQTNHNQKIKPGSTIKQDRIDIRI
jgi:hypothetical protein